jgi:arylsulfatase A-like enzyme
VQRLRVIYATRKQYRESEIQMKRRDFLKLAGATTGILTLDSWLGPVARYPAQAGANPPRPNIVLIIADALRSDHLSTYGYSRTTTANVTSWIASQGVAFQQATSAATWTFPANASIMTGRSPARFSATWDVLGIPASVTTLAEYLHDAGYYNAAFVSAPFVRGRYGFSRGFDLYDETAVPSSTSAQGIAAQVNTRAATWLGDNWSSITAPVFLFLYYFDPHTWYNPLAPYDTWYDPTYTGLFTGDYYKDGKEVQTGQVPLPNSADVHHLQALYDGEIAYWDYYLGQMLTLLNDLNLLNNSLVILTADHGDMFGEHGKWTHGNCLYEEVLRVPLLMRYPGVVSPGAIVTQPVQSMDLMPTILDWLEITPPSDLQAVSIRALAEGQTASARDVFSEIEGVTDPQHWAYWQAPHVPLRSVRHGDWKLIHHVTMPQADELYSLNSVSQYETTNQLTNEPALAQQLRDIINAWFGLHSGYLPVVLK